MRSSERLRRASAGLAIAACGSLAACAPGADRAAAAVPAVTCEAPAATPAGVSAKLAELRRSVEAGALYAAAAAAGPASTCSLAYERGVLSVSYAFRDGSSLRATSDPAIEYADQEARFANAPRDDALSILRRAERQSYAPNGCGIDWARPDERVRDGEATVEVFRGNACNCQGRVRSDGRGRVTALTLRSAC